MLLVLALLAAWPELASAIEARIWDGWGGSSPGAPFAIALGLLALTFLLVRLLFAWRPLRLAATAPRTKERRVRRRALELFRTAAEKRTRAATGVLLYLSLDERRAELIADESIHSRVEPETWGEAMADLVEEVKAGRPGVGMARAVERIGAVLAEHFPRSADDRNELPDRLIEL
jgi:putative membrane protein